MEHVLEVIAGFGVAPITPTAPTPLAGFGVRTAPSQGTHDALYARALALGAADQAMLLIVLDVLGVDAGTAERIRARLADSHGLRAERVAITATHTHGGPVVLSRARLGVVDPVVLERVEDGAVAAAQAALDAREPTTMRAGFGHEATVAHNRRVPRGPIDPSVGLLRFERVGGEVSGLLVSYACHPVTVGPDNLLFTRDYPGVLTDVLEGVYPGATVLFATGCCGQLNTGHSAEDSMVGAGLELRTFHEAARLGKLLAAAALHASERLADPRAPDRPRPGPLAAARTEVALPLRAARPPDATEREAKAEELEAMLAADSPPGERLILEAWLAWSESADFSVRSVAAEVQCLRVGPVCLALFPGEPFVEFGLELRAARPDLMVVPIGYANAAPGYLPHASAFEAGGYEVASSYLFYGQAAPYAPEMGGVLLKRMLETVRATDPQAPGAAKGA